MNQTVDALELQRAAAFYLRRVELGERLVVTDRDRPVAELVPVTTSTALDRLIAEGKVRPPKRKGPLPKPLKLPPGADPEAGTRALEEVRGYR
jgi:antitoxin (DNA-binding transcriptional repressor) of toxin-antitoxin stability system